MQWKVCKADHLHPPSSILYPAHVLAIGLVLSDEIVKLREYRAANSSAEAPQFEDPGFRALVEENVKDTVSRIANDGIMTDVSGPHLHSYCVQEISWLFLLIDDPAR